ncbi:hypothetical protein PUN28_014737 [Cardiocondyla obscurior]|uniref:Uncharacterized protein n=1 Tax=Cardiocondyla obscurior TaxID=286306 RepID=A0AAW2EYZ9_9HYME
MTTGFCRNKRLKKLYILYIYTYLNKSFFFVVFFFASIFLQILFRRSKRMDLIPQKGCIRSKSARMPRNPRAVHEERRHVLFSRSGVATPALFRFVDTCPTLSRRCRAVKDVGWLPPSETPRIKKKNPAVPVLPPFPLSSTVSKQPIHAHNSAYPHAYASDRTCIREYSALSLRFIIGSRPDITTRTLLIERRDADEPTPLIPIHPHKNCIG